MKGTVKKTPKGFGFIIPEGKTDADKIFFHASQLKGISFEDLQEEAIVTYDATPGEGKGPAAENVQLAA